MTYAVDYDELMQTLILHYPNGTMTTLEPYQMPGAPIALYYNMQDLLEKPSKLTCQQQQMTAIRQLEQLGFTTIRIIAPLDGRPYLSYLETLYNNQLFYFAFDDFVTVRINAVCESPTSTDVYTFDVPIVRVPTGELQLASTVMPEKLGLCIGKTQKTISLTQNGPWTYYSEANKLTLLLPQDLNDRVLVLSKEDVGKQYLKIRDIITG